MGLISQERVKEQIVDDNMPQVGRETVVEHIVDVPVLQFQEGVAEQIVDFTAASINEEVVEVIQPLPQGEHRGAHRGADSGILGATCQGERGGCIFALASDAHSRGHREAGYGNVRVADKGRTPRRVFSASASRAH